MHRIRRVVVTRLTRTRTIRTSSFVQGTPDHAGPKFHDQKLGLMLAKVAGTRSKAIKGIHHLTVVLDK